jgi:hypothetical protein
MLRCISKCSHSEPHVGLDVCMAAFHKVPANMRERLVGFNDGLTRLIGGSADTMYIPGRHVANFKQVLEIFLETDCFLEIALPTTLHLVVPLNESILFVDHVRLPFNAENVISQNLPVVDMGASLQCKLRSAKMG